MIHIAVIDTTFSRIDMGAIVLDELTKNSLADRMRTSRRTVPGFKDLAAAARNFINGGADIVVACAMPGPEPIDESCAKDASFGLQMVQALTGVPVLEVFVHMAEAMGSEDGLDEAHLAAICERRCRGHADNASTMMLQPEVMITRAGTGRRQGADHEGSLAAR